MKKMAGCFLTFSCSIVAYVISFGYLFLGIFTANLIAKLFGCFYSPLFLVGIQILCHAVIVLLFSLVFAIIKSQNCFTLIKYLSTLPGKQNFHWQGGVSLFSGIILYSITFLRIISCLQFAKMIYRGFFSGNSDFSSKRSNVSPFFQEGYFIFWAVFLLIQLSFGLKSELVYALDLYFIVESLFWILYYSIFRRFYEESYSIYHVLEHLPIIIILIPLQSISYALMCSFFTNRIIDWKNVFIVLLGEAQKDYMLFSFMGFLYSAIVISTILSVFPQETVKRGIANTVIIGAGDVVKYRLLPALIKQKLPVFQKQHSKINIYYLDKEEIDDKFREEYLDSLHIKSRKKSFAWLNFESVYNIIDSYPSGLGSIAWVCTPSDTHWYYTNILKDKASFIAIEKPIANNSSDLAQFKEYIKSDYRSKTFFLSYYLLEKALPLTFLCRPHKLYLRYLCDNTNNQDGIKQFYTYYHKSLGSGIIAFAMSIIEGKEGRTLPFGGQLFDTFIHNCLIASMFVGLPYEWEIINKINVNTHVKLKAKTAQNVKVELEVIKDSNIKTSKQHATISFGNGSKIEANFKEKTACYYEKGNSNPTVTIKVSDLYKEKYSVQCDMVYECYYNNISTADVDGLYNQAEVLDWIINVFSKNNKS